MTHEQLIRLAFASTVAPAFFVLKHLEEKYGRLDLADLHTLDDNERKAVWDAVPREFMVRVANQLNAAECNQIAEMLGPERTAKVHEVVATFLREQAKTA